MKKFIFVSLFFIFYTSTFSVEIDMALLETAKPVNYIEDSSPVAWKDFNTGKQIRDMGRRLGVEILRQDNKVASPFASGSPSFKYSARRVYSSEYRPGADILHIGNNATVGTAKCLFRIVSGYIEKAYNIPMEKADVIAEKVCWWNNNHFDEINYFSSNFNPAVVEAFSDKTEVIGLATSYKDWAGKTRIIIPLVFVKQSAPTANTPDNSTLSKNNSSKADSANLKNINTADSTNTSATNNEGKNTNSNASGTSLENIANSTANTDNKIDNDNQIKKESDTTKNLQNKKSSEKEKIDMPINYKILFAVLILAAILLIILLVKVILEIIKGRG